MFRHAAIPSVNTVFVHHSILDTVCDQFPELTVVNPVHLIVLPAGKFPDYRNPRCIRRISAEITSVSIQMAAQKIICIKNFASIKSVNIHFILHLATRVV